MLFRSSEHELVDEHGVPVFLLGEDFDAGHRLRVVERCRTVLEICVAAVPARLELGGAFLTARGFVDDDLGRTRAIDPPPLVGKDPTVISDAGLPQPQLVDEGLLKAAAAARARAVALCGRASKRPDHKLAAKPERAKKRKSKPEWAARRRNGAQNTNGK